MSKAKIDNADQFQITYKCNKEDAQAGHITAVVGGQGKSLSFKCELCGLTLFPVFPKMELSAHMHTKKTIKHDLLSVRTLGVVAENKAAAQKIR